MPSWPARLISHSSSTPAQISTNINAEPPPDRHGQRPRFPNPLVASAHSAPLITAICDSPESITSHTPDPSRSRSSHGRSISNPFPTLFGAGKKSDRAAATGSSRHLHGLESSDEEINTNDDGNGYSPGRPRENGDGNMMTGRCITCDGLMQWPRDVYAFKCTRCMTTNDLKPTKSAWTVRGPHGADSNPLRTGTPPKAPVLSITVTQSLIDRCITRYLHARRVTFANRDVRNEDASRQIPSSSKSSLLAHGAGEWPTEQQRPQDNSHTAQLTSMNTQPLPPIPRPGSRQNWVVNSQGRNAGAEVHSTSMPGWIPSPMEQMLRNEIESEVPPAPMRQPPQPPPATTSRQRQTGKHSFDATIRLVTREQASYLDPGSPSRPGSASPRDSKDHDRVRSIFEPLEEYIITCITSWDCINSSFSTARPKFPPRSISDDPRKVQNNEGGDSHAPYEHAPPLSKIDAKTLLIGDFAENGSWWTGHRGDEGRPSTALNSGDQASANPTGDWGIVSHKTPHIDWVGLNDWYQLILRAGGTWRQKWEDMDKGSRKGLAEWTELLQEIEHDISQARLHLQRTLLKATESLLKRPGRRLKSPQDIRFLLILLANPLIYGSSSLTTRASHSKSRGREGSQGSSLDVPKVPGRRPSQLSKDGFFGTEQLSGIIKRILGLLANLSTECHHVLITWFSRFSESHFRRLVDLINSFVSYRLSRQRSRTKSSTIDPTAGLIPDLGGPGQTTSAQLHAALGIMSSSKGVDGKAKMLAHSGDWQIKAAAKVMALLFAANNSGAARRFDSAYASGPDAGSLSAGLAAKQRACRHGQMIPTSAFYNTMLDYGDLVVDFEAWESRRAAFSFCQYPFFLSIWAKIRIMEYDARRQMELKAREAFFDSIMNRKEVSQHLVLKIRRDCLVEDSLRGVSEVIGAGQEDIKKGLRIDFVGEEGVDAGGLRKEWFLLLVRDVFDPDHGLFLYDEESHYCYFNPYCFETSDQFFLVGVLLGLAIYNTTNLDISLPPFIFKKLLASAPSSSVFSTSSRGAPSLFLEDLAEYRPALAKGLQQLLDYEGDVEEVFCRDFVADTERYGQTVQTPLCANGEKTPVTNANRREFVDLYVRYLLDTAVARQFEPFKRGFYTVCGGNALSLFRPEEIELLVRGSDEALDVSSLRGVASYENWGGANPGDTEAVIGWFWDFFGRANAKDQRKILGFITGSDRIPAMGATSLSIKISCLGDDCERFPVARTCFNSLCLWRYATRAKLERKLWTAVVESEGFGLK